jgi:hypothetical protein
MSEVQQQLDQAVAEAALILNGIGMDTPDLSPYSSSPHGDASLPPGVRIAPPLPTYPLTLPTGVKELIILAGDPGAQRT